MNYHLCIQNSFFDVLEITKNIRIEKVFERLDAWFLYWEHALILKSYSNKLLEYRSYKRTEAIFRDYITRIYAEFPPNQSQFALVATNKDIKYKGAVKKPYEVEYVPNRVNFFPVQDFYVSITAVNQ